MPSKKVAWIEGETLSQDLIHTLADKIVKAELPDGVENRWEHVFTTPFRKWVEYTPVKDDYEPGKYTHTDGVEYSVVRAKDLTSVVWQPYSTATPIELVDENGFLWERTDETNELTNRKIQVREITYTDENGTHTVPVPRLLLALVNDPDAPTGKKAIALKQGRMKSDGTFEADPNWKGFYKLCDMPDDWTYFMQNSSVVVYDTPNYNEKRIIATEAYSYEWHYYVAQPVKYVDETVVFKGTPDAAEGQLPKDYYIMFRRPVQYDNTLRGLRDQYNYIDVYYGEGFTAVEEMGDASFTYEGACQTGTVIPGKAPVIENMDLVDEIYKKFNDPTNLDRYAPPKMEWSKDFDGTTQLVSPPAHYFYGSNSTLEWLTPTNRLRRPDYWVKYYLSLNNDRVTLVLEGDPSPDLEAYYRSFAYIGKIHPFADDDVDGNFGVTVGMGHIDKDSASADEQRTGIILDDIKQDKNPLYSGFGRYTSNGMYSFSMLRTRSRVLYQAYYPSFITQGPNYAKGPVGGSPNGRLSLELEKNGFQPSVWTEKYHASPIYLVHQYEGYRGHLEGVVAINDHNLINLDELIVDTEELKETGNPSKGTWTEVYKFFSLKSPVNFFKTSANPIEMTIAILKEVK